jgi:hypothetical protein
MPDVSSMEDIERFWNAVRVHRVEATPEVKGPESALDIALERLKTELPRTLERYLNKDLGNVGVFTNAVVDASRILVNALFEEQQKQDISLMIQLFLEVPGKSPVEIKGFMRSLPRTLIDKILSRMELNKQWGGLQMMLTLEALFRDGSLHQDYEVTKETDTRLQIIFYPKERTGPLSFRLREMFIGT